MGRSKEFTIRLKAPKGLSKIRVNVRGILWIRGSRDTRKIPSSGYIYDQQGFAVKQFEIDII